MPTQKQTQAEVAHTMEQETTTKFSIEKFLRKFFKKFLDAVGAFLNRSGITLNVITITGLIGNIVAAIFIALNHLLVGGIIAMVMGPLDALDGTMARLRNEPSKYGSFIDSVTDRYSELILLAGLLIHFQQDNDWLGTLLIYFTAMGSVLVSYIRAKAESLGYNAKFGLVTRVERYLILIPGIIFAKPHIPLAIIALLGNVTALQRFFYVRKQARKTFTKEEVKNA
jgi:CDP-diacylglycerol--glycerol-3-phosphate 3-phosphatidyltransferase